MGCRQLWRQLRDHSRGAGSLLVPVGLGLVCAILAPGCDGPSSAPRFVARKYAAPDGEKRRYLVFLPRDYSPGDRRPLLMFLNGAGEDGTDGFRQIRNNFGYDVWRMRDAFPFVAVMPQRRSGKSWIKNSSRDGPSEAAVAMAILDAVERDYGTDPDRVYLTGVSSGGQGTWEVASAYPDRFAAVVPMCGSGGTMTALADANVQVWSFWNDGDEPLATALRRQRGQLVHLGRSPLATEYHGEGHNCWTRGYAHVGMYEWLLRQSRTDNERQDRRFTLVPPESVLADWTRRGDATWRASDDQVLVCRGVGSEEQSAVVAPTLLGNGELHVDAKWTTGTALSIALYDQAAVAPQLVLTVPHADVGIGGLWVRDERRFVPLHPVGQRQLDAQGWNDLRMSKQGAVLSFAINGVASLRYRSPTLNEKRHRIGLLAPQTREQEVCWRYVRWRSSENQRSEITQETAPAQSAAKSHSGFGTVQAQVAEMRLNDVQQQLSTAWQLAESRFSSGQLGWTICSDRFHRFGLYPLPGAVHEGTVTVLHRLVLDGARWRYDGSQTSSITMGVPQPPTTRSDEHKFFMALMDAQTLPRYKPQGIVHSSAIWSDASRKTTLWRRTADAHARLLIEPLPRREDEAKTASSDGQVRLEDALLDAVLLSVRPMSDNSLAPCLDRCQLVEQSGPIRWRRPLVVLSAQLEVRDKDEACGERRYWLDPGRDYAILRVVETRGGKPAVQVDVRYSDDDDSRALPAAWHAMTLDENGDVSQFVQASRRGDWIKRPAQDETFAVQLPPDTWVVDRAEQRSYIARADGSRLELNGREYEPGASFAQLVSQGGQRTWLAAWTSWAGERKLLQKWRTLPAALVAALACGGLSAVICRIVRQRRAVRHARSARSQTMRG